MSYLNFCIWVGNAILTGAWIFFFTRYALYVGVVSVDGYSPDIWFTSIILYTAVIFVF